MTRSFNSELGSNGMQRFKRYMQPVNFASLQLGCRVFVYQQLWQLRNLSASLDKSSRALLRLETHRFRQVRALSLICFLVSRLRFQKRLPRCSVDTRPLGSIQHLETNRAHHHCTSDSCKQSCDLFTSCTYVSFPPGSRICT